MSTPAAAVTLWFSDVDAELVQLARNQGRAPHKGIHGDRRRATRGIGWEYVHVAVDDHSRVAYVEVLADQLGTTCAAFLSRAVGWFRPEASRCDAC